MADDSIAAKERRNMVYEKERIAVWLKENTTGEKEIVWANGIEWMLARMKDGWIAVFEITLGRYIPRVQARDMAHAMSYIGLTEQVPVPINVIA